jgi:hypothetical protein
MKYDIITIPTVTLALKAKKALAKQGIEVRVVKLSEITRNNGCAYGIEFNAFNAFSVISVLKEADIPYKYLTKE